MKLDGMDGLVMRTWRGYFRSGQIFVNIFFGEIPKKKKKTLEFYPHDK